MEAIILAGGAGTRLGALDLKVPKPMVNVAGRPFLEWLLTYLHTQAVSRVWLAVYHGAELIIGHFGSSWNDMEISYSIEATPMGTGGALRIALEKTDDDDIVILNGDTLLETSLRDMQQFHKRCHADITIAVHHESWTARYGKLTFNSGYKITGFYEKDDEGGPGWINAGTYILCKERVLNKMPSGAFSFEKEFLEGKESCLSEYCYIADGYFIDIGVPTDLEKAQRDFERQIPLATRRTVS